MNGKWCVISVLWKVIHKDIGTEIWLSIMVLYTIFKVQDPLYLVWEMGIMRRRENKERIISDNLGWIIMRIFEGVLHNLNLCRTDLQKNLLPKYQKLFIRQVYMFWLFLSLLTLGTFQCYSNVYSVWIFPGLPTSCFLMNRFEPFQGVTVLKNQYGLALAGYSSVG